MAYAFPDVFQTLHQDVIATRSPGNEPRRSTHGVGFTEMRLIKSNLPPNSAGMDRLESPNQVISRDGLKHPLESVHIGGSISIDVWLSSKEERMQTAEGRRYVYLRHLGPESLDGGLAFLPPSSWLIVTTIGDPVRVRIFACRRTSSTHASSAVYDKGSTMLRIEEWVTCLVTKSSRDRYKVAELMAQHFGMLLLVSLGGRLRSLVKERERWELRKELLTQW
ncbi:uncharacterized protein PV07_01613 [Cladophialophora immunda]|uniref:Uncharacterized protein n=1 Tax=Cladophialophora immunda TaxID=569365 RepID=A0A0D2A3I7_9EURO|nr:uncharacterized protein PV07_01613 [Cladophialophora immunda]KIW34866.1 hypothetical protein PV07_01613 [Cladophialophora immunda]